MLEMTSDSLTNAEKHVTPTIACVRASVTKRFSLLIGPIDVVHYDDMQCMSDASTNGLSIQQCMVHNGTSSGTDSKFCANLESILDFSSTTNPL